MRLNDCVVPHLEYIMEGRENQHDSKIGFTPMSLRERVGLTQQQVAIAMGVRPSTISDWERGVYQPRLYLADVQKLCAIYQCSLDELVSAFRTVKKD